MEPTRETRESAGAESEVKQETRQLAEDATERASKLAREARGEVEETAEGLMSSLADQLESFASELRDQDLDSILERIKTTARENPGLFFAGSVFAGLAVTRFAKSSAKKRAGDEPEHRREESQQALITTPSEAPLAPASTAGVGQVGYSPETRRSTDGHFDPTTE